MVKAHAFVPAATGIRSSADVHGIVRIIIARAPPKKKIKLGRKDFNGILSLLQSQSSHQPLLSRLAA